MWQTSQATKVISDIVANWVCRLGRLWRYSQSNAITTINEDDYFDYCLRSVTLSDIGNWGNTVICIHFPNQGCRKGGKRWREKAWRFGGFCLLDFVAHGVVWRIQNDGSADPDPGPTFYFIPDLGRRGEGFGKRGKGWRRWSEGEGMMDEGERSGSWGEGRGVREERGEMRDEWWGKRGAGGDVRVEGLGVRDVGLGWRVEGWGRRGEGVWFRGEAWGRREGVGEVSYVQCTYSIGSALDKDQDPWKIFPIWIRRYYAHPSVPDPQQWQVVVCRMCGRS